MKTSNQKKTGPDKDIDGFVPILASIREAVIIADPKGKIIFANPASEIITNCSPGQLVGQDIQKAIVFKCAKTDPSWFLPEALTGWRAVELPESCYLIQQKGKEIPVAATSTPIYAPGGDYSGIVLILRDLTEEAKLKRRQYDFLSFVSHQLRQPIASLSWGLEALVSHAKCLENYDQEILRDLLQITRQFQDFIGDLINIARFEEGRIEFKIERVDIKKIVSAVAQELKGLAISQNVNLRLFPEARPQDSLIINGDNIRLHDVFLNLLSNAILYNRPRGTVTVEGRPEKLEAIEQLAFKAQGANRAPELLRNIVAKAKPGKPFLLISVSDTGIGLPADQQGKVFESFFRATNAVKKGLKGSGLGLFIVKSIVEKLGGSIFFKSQEGVGTTFYLVFELPEEL